MNVELSQLFNCSGVLVGHFAPLSQLWIAISGTTGSIDPDGKKKKATNGGMPLVR